MMDITKIRSTVPSIIIIGSHPAIIQSILDFDYLAGKKEPSIKAILASGRKYEKYFFGKKEVLIPLFSDSDIPDDIKQSINFFLNVNSGRRTFDSTKNAMHIFPNLIGGSLFAENIPEKYSIELYELAQKGKVSIVGPASVGLLIPGILKLGAIGGIEVQQLVNLATNSQGNIAVFSASGGMTNELITSVYRFGRHLSLALSFGGDRFPCLTPEDAFLAAENDKQTEYIIYYGELGGYDEYYLADLLREKKITKKVIAYIGGSISEMFETPPQFGHAKAMAEHGAESAQMKRQAMRDAGAIVPETYGDFLEEIKKIPVHPPQIKEKSFILEDMQDRHHSFFSSSISSEKDDEVYVLGEDLVHFVKDRSFAAVVISLLLGKKEISKDLERFVDMVLKLLVDHGPYQSGPVNTMISARAGKDLVSALASGLLTIGPRFGGAINEAASNWLNAVTGNISVDDFVESYAKKRKYIAGIGHKKYSVEDPDPRVAELIKFTERLSKKRFITFAREVENITTSKKGNLILNVDGTIAAILLDILSESEKMTDKQLQTLIDIEFFNALFVLSRSVGFTAHYLDQRRLDEGLFRLSPEDVANVES